MPGISLAPRAAPDEHCCLKGEGKDFHKKFFVYDFVLGIFPKHGEGHNLTKKEFMYFAWREKKKILVSVL